MRIRRRIHSAILALLAGAMTLGCGAQTKPEVVERSGAALTAISPLPSACDTSGRCRASISVPSGMAPNDMAVVGTSTVRLAPRSRVLDGATMQPALLAALGPGGVAMGYASAAGSVTSLGRVTMEGQASVAGSIQSAGDVSMQQGARVSGSIVRSVFVVEPAQVAELTLPSGLQPGVNLEPGQRASAGPGGYASFNVKSSAELSLGAGSYVVSDLSLEPSSRMPIDNRSAAVELHVLRSFTCRGAFAPLETTANVRIVYWGTSSVAIECDLSGATIIAPFASVRIADRMAAGRVLAGTVELGADARILARTFHRLTTGPGATAVDQLDAAARAEACRRIDAYFGAASRESLCRLHGLAAARFERPDSDETARSTCQAAYQACMAGDHCNSAPAFVPGCAVTVDQQDVCLEQAIPARDAALANLPACADQTLFRLYTFKPQKTLVEPAACRVFDACPIR